MLLAIAGIPACASTDPALLDDTGQSLAELPRAPYRVAITSVKDPDGMLVRSQPEEDELPFHFGGPPEAAALRTALRAAIAEELDGLRAATSMFEIDDPGVGGERPTPSPEVIDAAVLRRADLVIVPVITSRPSLAHVQTTGGAFPAAGLWLVTWVGGLFVDDALYKADAKIEFHVYSPHGAELLERVQASSTSDTTHFFDRNDFASWGTLQSLIIPPFWTTDEAEVVGETLSRTIARRFAGRLTRFLKTELPELERSFAGEIDIERPLNGGDVDGAFDLAGEVLAGAPISGGLLAWIDETTGAPIGAPLDLTLEPAGLDDQAFGNGFRARFTRTQTDEKTGEKTEQRIDVPPGATLLHLEFRIGGRLVTRTLRVHVGTGAAEESR